MGEHMAGETRQFAETNQRVDLEDLLRRSEDLDRKLDTMLDRTGFAGIRDRRGTVAWFSRAEIQAVVRDRDNSVLIYIRGIAVPFESDTLTIEEVERQLGLVPPAFKTPLEGI
jgi:hypothetical protein